MRRRRLLLYDSVFLWQAALSNRLVFQAPVSVSHDHWPQHLPKFYALALRNLDRTSLPHREGLSAGFWSVWMYPHRGWVPEAKMSALIRDIVLLSFRELLRPRLRAWRQTKLSVKCMNLVLKWPACSKCHRTEVRMARSSRPLIWSPLRRHFQPATIFHFHAAPPRHRGSQSVEFCELWGGGAEQYIFAFYRYEVG